MYVLTAEQMQSIDQFAIHELGISQQVLMEKAALCAVEEIEKFNPVHVLCACGKGNNGGDGIAVARILKMKGICATVYLCDEVCGCKESIREQLEIFQKIGGKTITSLDFNEYDVIVDAIFGIGLEREITGIYKSVIDTINDVSKNKNITVISLDIPSGIQTDSGKVMGCAVNADYTIAFSCIKRGHLIYPGRLFTGELIVKDAGLYPVYSKLCIPKVGFSYLDDSECNLSQINKTAHKGSQGRALIIAGSPQMYGACYLSAAAAFKTGCGLVEIYTANENLAALKTMLPEAILHGFGTDDSQDDLKVLLKRADVVLIGPGISTSKFAHKCVHTVLEYFHGKIVLDADAINCIASDINMFYNHVNNKDSLIVMTPHPKELARFLHCSIDDVLNDYDNIILSTANAFRSIIVGKGASTIVSDGEHFYINCSGNEGMATAGSGDVLAGIITGLLAQTSDYFETVCRGVYIHGRSGDFMVKQTSKRGLLASDLLEGISHLNLIFENNL